MQRKKAVSPILEQEYDKQLLFQTESVHCRGLFCTALIFMKSDGFPADKPAEVPCFRLKEDFSCDIRERLAARGDAKTELPAFLTRPANWTI